MIRMNKEYNLRLLQGKDLVERGENGELRFKSKYKKEEIEHNKHYLIKDKGIIIQINTNYNKIGCHDVGFSRVPLYKLSEDEQLELISNMVNSGANYVFDIDVDDDEDEYYFQYEVGLKQQPGTTTEEYLENIKEHSDEILGVLKSVSILDREDGYQLNHYTTGSVIYREYSNSEGNGNRTSLQVAVIVGKLNGLFQNENDLEEIQMVEKDIIQHPYSKLHVLLAYLEENREDLPKEVQDALAIGLEDSLQTLSKKFKDSKTYAK